MNTDAPWPDLEAEHRVLVGIQAKLHQWATDDPHRRFDDRYNLVADPAFLVVGWDRVRGNRGARSAGVDGVAPRSIVFGRERFLTGLRDDLKARRFAPLPVREKLIPKSGGKLRGLGIPTARDRTVQAALKLVLEPIRGGLQAGQLRLPPKAPSPGRHCRDSPVHLSVIRVGARRGHHGVLRRDLACRPHGPGAGQSPDKQS